MGSQRIFSASFAILSELCGQKPFACGQQNPLTAKNAKISARRSRRKTTLHRYSLLEATSQRAFFATFANLGESLRLKAFCLWTQNSLAAKKNLHAPQIISLRGVVLAEGVQGQPGAVQVGGEGNWKRLGKVLSHRRCKCRRSWFRLCWRNPSGCSVRLANQVEQMMIGHVLNLVGQNNESAINFIQFATIELVTELFAAQAEGVPSGMLAEYQPRIGNPNRLRSHNFVGQRILQHAILVNAGFVSECIASNDGFVGLDRDTGNLAEHLARRVKLFADNAGVVGVVVRAHPHRHNNFLQRRIPRALTNTVNGALYLACACFDGGERIRYG